MNWFNKKNIVSTETSNSSSVHTIDPQMEKFERIFLDTEQPSNSVNNDVSDQKGETAEPKPEQLKSGLETFLNTDYDQLGYSDGYNFHSEKYLELKIEELKGDCLLHLERELQNLQSEAHNLIINVRSYPSDDFIQLREQLEVRHEQVHQLISNLMSQKDLLFLGQGLIQKPIAKYRAAYFKGAHHYQECEILSKPLTSF